MPSEASTGFQLKLLSLLACLGSAQLVQLYREALSSAAGFYSSLHFPLPAILLDLSEHLLIEHVHKLMTY